MKLNFEYTTNKELGYGALKEMKDSYSFSQWKELSEKAKKKMKEEDEDNLDDKDDVEKDDSEDSDKEDDDKDENGELSESLTLAVIAGIAGFIGGAVKAAKLFKNKNQYIEKLLDFLKDNGRIYDLTHSTLGTTSTFKVNNVKLSLTYTKGGAYTVTNTKAKDSIRNTEPSGNMEEYNKQFIKDIIDAAKGNFR